MKKKELEIAYKENSLKKKELEIAYEEIVALIQGELNDYKKKLLI